MGKGWTTLINMRNLLKKSFVICTTLFFIIPINSYATSKSDIDAKLKELEEKQQNIQKKEGSLRSDQKDTESKIDDNLDKQSAIEKDLRSIDEELAETTAEIQQQEEKIAGTNRNINQLEESIQTLAQEIIDLEEKIQKRDEILQERLRSIQQTGGLINFIEVLLESKNFTDFISRASAVNTIMDQDKVI